MRTRKEKEIVSATDVVAHDLRKLSHHMQVFEAARTRMDNDYTALLEQYPNRWVAVGQDGLIDHSDSPSALVTSLNDRGINNWEYALGFLDPQGTKLLL